jgi:serine/threonine protein kinase/class 3 adenylate cyclase
MAQKDEQEESQAAGAERVGLTAESRAQMEQFRAAHETKVLTILLSDLEESTKQQAKLGNVRAAELVQEYRSVFRAVLQDLDGHEIETAGDLFLVVFAAPSEGVKFALSMQAAMRTAREEEPEFSWARVGIHQGQVVVERYAPGARVRQVYGLQVSVADRIMELARGGQILCSRAVFDDARAILRSDELQGLAPVAWLNHGPYHFKGIEDTYDVCEVGEEGVAALEAPPATTKSWPAGEAEEQLGWRPAAGVVVPGTNWRLEERLGKEDPEKEGRGKYRGEFGEVWKAWNPSDKSRQVFKFCFKRDRLAVLKREARLLKHLRKHRNPNVAEVYDVTEAGRPPYYLEMEYVQGPSMEEWLATDPPLADRLEIVAQVADALDTVHTAGIYHRDIKPSNILLTYREDGALQAKLTDFGLGAAEDEELLMSIRASRVEGVAGTWDYIAPELREGGKASPQSDLYSLGLTLFQIAAGNLKAPAGPGWERLVAGAILRQDLAKSTDGEAGDRWGRAGPGWGRLVASEILRQDIAKCMERDPGDRWRRAGELAAALRSHGARLERLLREQERQERLQRARDREARTRSYFDVVASEWDRVRRLYIDDTLAFHVVASLVRPEAVVLEVGAGTGEILVALGLRVARAIGVDNSEKMLRVCQDRVDKYGLTNVTLKLGEAEALPVGEEECDIACSSMVLHHLGDPPMAVREMARVVKAGGSVVICDLVKHEYDWVRELMADVWLGFTEEQIRQWLTEAGLADITYSSAAVPPPLEEESLSKLRAFVATAKKPQRGRP